MRESTVTSVDGTRIVYEQQGSGPALVLVHAGFVDRAFWGPSLPLLAQHFSVYAMDRRGHGASDPYRAGHAIEREVEDVLAVLAAAGGPVAVLGHSSGSQVALHAARRSPAVRRLVLYEPPRFESFTPQVRAGLHAGLAAGDLESLVATVLLDVVEATTSAAAPPPEARQQMLAGLRRAPIWSAALRNARSIPAEVDSYAAYRFDPAEFRDFATPAVLLLGGASGPVMRGWVEGLHAALPSSRIVRLEGEGHGAMLTAPELFAQTVREAVSAG